MKGVSEIKKELIIRVNELLFDLKRLNKEFKKLTGLFKTRIFKIAFVSVFLLMSFQSVVSFDSNSKSNNTNDVSILDSTDIKVKKVKPEFEVPVTYSYKLINSLKKHEGVRLTAYNIGDGAYTIGYGHAVFNSERKGGGDDYPFLKTFRQYIKMRNRGEDITITQKQAEQLFRDDLTLASNALNRLLNQWAEKDIKPKITQPMYDAMVSMIYNMGNNNFRKTEFIQLVKISEFKQACEMIKKTSANLFKKYRGLISRRNDESKMFEGYYPI
jgi:lysozyme